MIDAAPALGAKPIRRSSAAGRAVQAATQAFQPTLAASPMIRLCDDDLPRPVTRPPPLRTTTVSVLRDEAAALAPVRRPENSVARLTATGVACIAGFVGATFAELRAFARVCWAWQVVARGVVADLTLHPREASVAALSRPGALAALGAFLASGRAQHIERFRVVDPRVVYTLPRSGCVEASALDLVRVVTALPQLVHLDVRGVVLRQWAPFADNFLNDVAARCRNLTVLRCGVAFLHTWAPQWWVPLTRLSEFVVGSRREDTEWSSRNPAFTVAAAAVPEDLCSMLRALPIAVLKLWCPLAANHPALLLHPPQPFHALQHLTVNVDGNSRWRPLEDGGRDEARDPSPAKGKDGTKLRGRAQADDVQQNRTVLPVLTSLTLVDCHERPELLTDLMSKYAAGVAPNVQHFTAVNTHRTAPSRPEPQSPRRVR